MKVAILVRVSSRPDRQDHDRQISDLTALAHKNKRETVKVITAKVSATKTRLTLREVYEYLTGRGISIYIQSLGLDTGGRGPFQKAINNIIVTILAEIAELETVRLSQRIRSGMDEARRKGKVVGRPKGTTDDVKEKLKTNPKYRRAAKVLRIGLSLRKTAAFAGISVNTARKMKPSIESAG